MQGADALQHLAHQGRLGRIGKALTDMPLGQSRQAQLQGAAGQGAGVIDQVAHDGVAGRRQKATPAHLEVLDGLLVAAPGVGPGAGLQIALDFLIHRPSPLWRTVIRPQFAQNTA
ncbi:hypothetical protein D3C84_1003390 [compost metagenome]